MTTPSDFDAEHAIETAKQPQSQPSTRHIWALRIAGVLFVISGWAVATANDLSPRHMLINAVAFGGLAAYGLVAAAASRRISVNLEKRLRLDLLVHNMELENMAMRDDLTRLFNRRYFFERLERELETSHGFQRPLSVLLIDVDQLKAVNDTYGHRTGDEVLANFGQFLLGQTRASDVPARIGGDEFAVILPDTSESAAEVMVSRIEKALETTDLIDSDHLTLRLTASLGVSGFPWGGEGVDAIMQQADASMYANKRARRQPAGSVPRSTDEVPAIYRKSLEGGDA
ncbi:MAG TPA: GGDEF domain-containing protein [Dehalococcoidia bacterium]|nr:GGDEF domain-containing protein [Dehalococcoidia bacterium]